MTYVWELSLSEITDRHLETSIYHYHQRLCRLAYEQLAALSPAGFQQQSARLNGIEERCNLLYHYLSNEYDLWFDTPEEMLCTIEKEYVQSRAERLEKMGAFDQKSLLYRVDASESAAENYLWQENLAAHLATASRLSPREAAVLYPRLMRYFNQLAAEADRLVQQMSSQAFDACYPQLLQVDAKCRLLLNGLPVLLTYAENEADLICLIEAEYIQAHEELFIHTPEWYEAHSLGCRLMTEAPIAAC